jgi:DNA replication protein DnaC
MNPCKTKWQQKWLRLNVVVPQLQELAESAEAFCGRWMNNNTTKSLLVIVGGFGSGKTHTARAIFRFCSAAATNAFETEKWGRQKFPESIFVSWPEAANEFNEKNYSLLQDILEDELVILDDIGAENDPWKICSDKLCQILSRRERKFTVITTNIQPTEWPTKFDGRINDRLLRNSVVIDLTGAPSYSLRV